ncbi:uncharacterized protein LOC117075562 [Trachypithecus francoisi]|uniref:uncharacterized protein LOC117075562 n=1 Tax=Trachypithecus francoisi TaxID=54180 RepID=UPI00141AD0EB|nr:uncharacterized protein LOC117075562 [Trachypithecus francoisi]
MRCGVAQSCPGGAWRLWARDGDLGLPLVILRWLSFRARSLLPRPSRNLRRPPRAPQPPRLPPPIRPFGPPRWHHPRNSWHHPRNISVTALPCQVLASLPLFLSGKAHWPGQALSSNGRQVSRRRHHHRPPRTLVWPRNGPGLSSRAASAKPSRVADGPLLSRLRGICAQRLGHLPEPLMPASARAFPRRARPLEHGTRDWAPRVSAALVEMAAELEEPRPWAMTLGSQSCDNRPCSMIMFFFMRT